MTKEYKDVTIVIPTLNEEEAIPHVLDELLAQGIPSENILVVDGYSTDKTREIARMKGVRVILQEGEGKTDAIKTAVRHIKTPITLVMDGDYTYPAKHIPSLVQKIREGYDLAIGARNPEKEAQTSIYRLGNWILGKTFTLLFGVKITDVLSGMYAVKTSILQELFYESRGFGIESEMVAHVAATGGEIVEEPIHFRKRKGRKKLKVRHGASILWDMIRLAWRYNPTMIIFALGALLLIPGLTLTAYVGYHYLAHGIKHYVKGLIAIALVTTGVISLLLTILAIYLKRMEIRILKQIKQANKKQTLEK